MLLNKKCTTTYILTIQCDMKTEVENFYFDRNIFRHMKFWKGYYCRWNPRMRPQDSVHHRHAQLLSLKDQLQSKVDSLTKELANKKTKDSSMQGDRRLGGSGPSMVSGMSNRLESINI